MFRRKNTQNHGEDDYLQQKAKVAELRAAIGPLTERGSKYCTDACLRRYLVARNWNVIKATKMMEDTLKWRALYRPEDIRWPEVEHEGETGKVYRAEFYDRLDRIVLVMRPGKQNTNSAEGNVRHLVYMLENAILNLVEGQEQMSWLIDFRGWSYGTSVPVRTAREIVNILQNHYPERLGVSFLYNPPRIFETFYKAVKYFLDPKTAEKVKFVYPNDNDSVELMKSYFDTENLPIEFGGKATLEYDHKEFSKRMLEDDIKSEKFWGSAAKASYFAYGNTKAEVVPEQVLLPQVNA